MAGWIDEVRFYVLLHGTSVISELWEGDNEKPCNRIPFPNEKIFASGNRPRTCYIYMHKKKA